MALYSRQINIYGNEIEDLEILNEILFLYHEEYENHNPSITPELLLLNIQKTLNGYFKAYCLKFEMVHDDFNELTRYTDIFIEFSKFWGYSTLFLYSIKEE